MSETAFKDRLRAAMSTRYYTEPVLQQTAPPVRRLVKPPVRPAFDPGISEQNGLYILAPEELCGISSERTLGDVGVDMFVSDSRPRKSYLLAPPTEVLAALALPQNNPTNFVLAFNYIVAIVFTIAAIATAVTFIYIYSKYGVDSNADIIPLWLYDHSEPGTATKTFRISEKTISGLCVAFLGLTAFAHFFYALNFGGSYTTNVVSGSQPWRWIEYSVTATIMTAIVSILSGVRDTNTFISLIVACISMILTGAWWEATHSVLPLISGFALLALINVVIIRSFVYRVRENNAARDTDPSLPRIPKFVWAALISTLILFSCFGLVPVAQIMGFITNPVSVETTYVVLSITSKLLLAGLISWGFAARLIAAQKEAIY